MSTAVRHIVPCQRRHYRVAVPIVIAIDGYDYDVENWSISGFKIVGISGKFKEGDVRHIRLRIPFHGFDIGFMTKARIVRYDKKIQDLGGEFIDLDERKQETLNTFIQGVVR